MPPKLCHFFNVILAVLYLLALSISADGVLQGEIVAISKPKSLEQYMWMGFKNLSFKCWFWGDPKFAGCLNHIRHNPNRMGF